MSFWRNFLRGPPGPPGPPGAVGANGRDGRDAPRFASGGTVKGPGLTFPNNPPNFSKLSPSTEPRWAYCPGDKLGVSLKFNVTPTGKFGLELEKIMDKMPNLFTVSMMLHYAWCAEPFPNSNCESYRRGLAFLSRNGLIEVHHEHGQKYYHRATEKGRAWVKAVEDLPLPVAETSPKWVMPS